MSIEGQEKEIIDVIYTGALGALLAGAFKAVQIVRRDRHGQPITMSQVAVELAGASAVGAVTAWVIDDFHLSRNLTAAIIAVSGYIGGPLLDMVCEQARGVFDAGIQGLKTWLTEHKWSKD